MLAERSRRGWLRARAAARVGAARLQARPWRSLLVVFGVAAASALLVGVLGGSLIAENRALEASVAGLPPEQRAVRIDLFGLPIQQGYVREDRAARAASALLSPRKPLEISSVRNSLIDGEFVRLVGFDELARYATLRRGRLPRRCLPRACEVLQIGGRGRALLSEGGITLVRTGVGDLHDEAALGPAFQGLHAYGTQEGVRSPVVLIAPSVAAIERIPPLRFLYRVRSWLVPIAATQIRSWQIGDLLRRESRAQAALQDADSSFKLVAPDEALVEVRDQGRVSAQRMVLIGAGASALLVGFVMVAALGLRRGLAGERRRLLQRGATQPQIWIAFLFEVGAITFVAWLLGIASGALFVALLARSLGLPAAATLDHSVLEPPAILALVLTWGIATAVVVATTTPREGRRRRLGLHDVAALGAVLAVLVGVTRGALSPDSLASGGRQTILLLLPVLVCFAGAVAAARLLGPLMLLAERLSRNGPLPLRLALLALARAPARTAVACAFLVVSVGLAIFAASYRATLEQGARDESGFEVPLDFTLSEGSRLVQPLDAAPLGAYAATGSNVRAFPVLRRSADVAGSGTSTQGVTVLGVPPAALGRMHWRGDFSASSRQRLEQELAADGHASLRGALLPKDATRIRARFALHGAPLLVSVALEDPRGRVRLLSLGRVGRGVSTLTARVPRAAEGILRLTGLELALTRNGTNWFYHLSNEGRLVQAPNGTVTVGRIDARTSTGNAQVAIDPGSWVSRTPGLTIERRRPLRITYAFQEAQILVLRPRQPTDGHPLRVVVSPDVASAAGPGGMLSLDFQDLTVPAWIVGVVRRFPTLGEGEPFVVADESRLATALGADAPGTADPGEMWISAPGSSAGETAKRLHEPPFSALAFASRRALLAELERDPLALAIGYTLGAAALLALALSAIGLWISFLGELNDERGDFFDLEAQGVAPETLRAQARIRLLSLLAFGILAGVALGLVLSRLVVALVQVSAGTSSPQPPLVLEPGWITIGLACLALVLVAGLAAEVSLRGSFRGETPERAPWSLG